MIKPALFRYHQLATIVALLLLTGCSYEYKLSIRVIDSSGNPANANVRVIVMKQAYDEGELSALISDPVDSYGQLEISLCCSPKPQVWVYAFVDANASSHWDAGERLQTAQNPLHLTNDNTTVTIQFD